MVHGLHVVLGALLDLARRGVREPRQRRLAEPPHQAAPQPQRERVVRQMRHQIGKPLACDSDGKQGGARHEHRSRPLIARILQQRPRQLHSGDHGREQQRRAQHLQYDGHSDTAPNGCQQLGDLRPT